MHWYDKVDIKLHTVTKILLVLTQIYLSQSKNTTTEENDFYHFFLMYPLELGSYFWINRFPSIVFT